MVSVNEHRTVKADELVRAGSGFVMCGCFRLNFNSNPARLIRYQAAPLDCELAQFNVNRPEAIRTMLRISHRPAFRCRVTASVHPTAEPEPLERCGEKPDVARCGIKTILRMVP